MNVFDKCIVLDAGEALSPDVNELAKYEVILLPEEFRKETNRTIRLIYAAMRNVYYYNDYIL